MANWDEAGAGALSGAAAGLSFGPVGAAIGGVAGGLLGAFGSSEAPRYTDPNAGKRQVIANNLMSSKTGEEYAANQSAMNAHRGQSMFDEVSKDFGGNPAVSSSLYNNIERNTENENSSAGIEGARINSDNQREAAGILGQDSQIAHSVFEDNANRAGRPSVFDQVAGGALTQLAGRAVGGVGGPSVPGTEDGASGTAQVTIPGMPGTRGGVGDGIVDWHP